MATPRVKALNEVYTAAWVLTEYYDRYDPQMKPDAWGEFVRHMKTLRQAVKDVPPSKVVALEQEIEKLQEAYTTVDSLPTALFQPHGLALRREIEKRLAVLRAARDAEEE